MNTSENPKSPNAVPEANISCPNCGGPLTPDFVRAEASKLVKPNSPKPSLLVHWSFFETIDADLHEYSRYLEFDEANFAAYSVNFARLYLSICSEIDVILKMLCKHLGQPAKGGSDIGTVRVLIRPMNWLFVPWFEWKTTEKDNPPWWRSYNDVKHERNVYFAQANLKNVLLSASGLLVALLFWSHHEPRTLNWETTELKVFGFDKDQRWIFKVGAHLGSGEISRVAAPFPQPPAAETDAPSGN
jgi:hypothetical protein